MVILFFFLMIRRPPRSTLFSLHDALPISRPRRRRTHPDNECTRGDADGRAAPRAPDSTGTRRTADPIRRSEEHTSELQSQSNLVCRLLLEKKKQTSTTIPDTR